jgi:hypothetical protein
VTNQEQTQQGGNLLSEQERIAFKMIATGNDLHGQRAVALLAVDAGATQAEAARQAGLTPGQVKYWLGKFRQDRMQIFPEELLTIESVGQPAEKAVESGKIKKSKKKKAKSKSSKKDKPGKSAQKKDKGKKKKGKKKKKSKK